MLDAAAAFLLYCNYGERSNLSSVFQVFCLILRPKTENMRNLRYFLSALRIAEKQEAQARRMAGLSNNKEK